MIFSPEFRDRARKFRKNKRAFRSFIILCALFAATLPAELFFNDRPIVIRIDGTSYFPVFKDYTYEDMGGGLNVPVSAYRSTMFNEFLAGKTPIVQTAAMYGGGTGTDDAAPLELVTYEQGPPRKVWMLWPAIPHSYKSSPRSETLVNQRLASPFATTRDGKLIPGASEARHLLGTDKYGKDVLARLVYGFRLSLLFGLALAITSTILGSIIGGIQGYFGGAVDLVGQRGMEIWGAIPRLMLLMILSDFLSRQGEFTGATHLLMLFVIMNLTSWMGMAGHMRAQFLRARNLDYVRAAKSLGVSNPMIMFRHILPNSLTPIITFLPFSISGAIMALVGLDFLGFGLKYPAPSLGDLLSQGQQHMEAWWIMIPAFVTLTSLMILLTFIGDGVRNAFDPRYK
ncbi:MAG: ABC transporter permease [Verrucomicrobia bacterium]|jgi:microcin C transport system permease protein|nr:ABC transporter permease [Verrucomicrobiota bacterium]MBT7066353.1 ABC transporter permease [Verrucomicrobiota bacterium]